MYGEILDPSLPFLRCKTFRGLAFRTGPLDRRTSRYAAALQQSWPVPLGPLGARATTLFKRNSTSCLIGTHADVCPGYGCAWSSGIVPSDTRARIRRCEGRCIGIVAGVWTFQTSNFLLRTSAQAHPRRSCFAFAGWDSLVARSDRPRLAIGLHRQLLCCSRPLTTSICHHFSALVPMANRPASMLSQPLQSAASVTAVFSSYFSDRPAAKNASCSGQHSSTGADMRRRPSISIRWMHHCRRLFSTGYFRFVSLNPE